MQEWHSPAANMASDCHGLSVKSETLLAFLQARIMKITPAAFRSFSHGAATFSMGVHEVNGVQTTFAPSW